MKDLFLGIAVFSVLTLVTGDPATAQFKPQPLPPSAAEKQSVTGKAISMARATWDTGWFQTEIFKKLLEELGYAVKKPKTMDNLDFYLSAARGEMDLWANGWFPSHTSFLEEERVRGKVEAVGFEVRAGALQGYLVDQKTADALGIKNLSDLRDPKIAQAFDRNGNGKADLIGCNVGWGCELVVEHHLDAYALRATVEHIQGDYSPMEVPGCQDDPCAMGFPPNDIRVVANKQFLENFPDIRRLLEGVKIPLKDISRQNAKMLAGEHEDIRRHALDWITSNRQQIDRWLQAARALQPIKPPKNVSQPGSDSLSKSKLLRVVTKRFEPFVIYQDNEYTGFSILIIAAHIIK